jgi:WS/DGAT/MGAT family acyltransferase
MQPMEGIDAKFLYSETHTAHMHTIKVAVAAPSAEWTAAAGAGAGASWFSDLVAVLGESLGSLPPFRRRAVPVPFTLGHPVWVEDPEFDLAHHVSQRTAPAPGGERELAAIVGEVAGRPLRRDRPLWELVLVEGLAGKRIAVIAKIHHAVADGGAAVALLQSVVDRLATLSANATAAGGGAAFVDPVDHADTWHPEPIPGRGELVRMALREHRARLRGVPRLVARSVRGARESETQRRRMTVKPPLPLQAPRTSLNVSIDAARTFAMATLSLEDMKAVRRAHDATVNDVFLAICAGALREYLRDRHELPDRPLVASVPVSTDPGISRLSGNRVDNLYVSIGTDIADPVDRLRHIHQVAEGAKTLRRVLGHELLEQRAAVLPPQLYRGAVKAWTATGLANHVRPPLNVILSNVPGPREPIAFGPIELEAIYSVGPILEGIGCNITAWSYVDRLHVAVLGCPRSVPDPWSLADRLEGALAELVARTQGAPA